MMDNYSTLLNTYFEISKEVLGTSNEESLLRIYVLSYSITFEKLFSELICEKLNIDKENSICFGNNSKALSFDQKCNFLIDLKLLDKDQRTLISDFQFIRNKIAHVHYDDIKNLEHIYNKHGGLKNRLKILVERKTKEWNWSPEKLKALNNSNQSIKNLTSLRFLITSIMNIWEDSTYIPPKTLL